MISYARTRARQDLRDKSARGFRPRPCVHNSTYPRHRYNAHFLSSSHLRCRNSPNSVDLDSGRARGGGGVALICTSKTSASHLSWFSAAGGVTLSFRLEGNP